MKGFCLYSVVVLLLATWTTAQVDAGRRLMDAAPATKNVVLKERMLALLTKYELPSSKSIMSTAKVTALFGWQEEEKAIKYSIVGTDSASESLSATSDADIKGMHLGVMGSRSMAAKAEMPLAKAHIHMENGYKVYGAGTIMDANVSMWTNSMDIKTAADLWEEIVSGKTYLTILTTKYPAGEVRGQIDWSYEDLEVVEDLVDETLRKNPNAWRLTFLTPYEQVGAVVGNKTARGMAVYAFDGSKVLYNVLSGQAATDGLYMVKGYKDIGGAHIHVGAKRGADSSSIVPLTVPTDADWKTEKGLKIYAQGTITDENVMKALATNANSSSTTITTAKALFDKILAGDTYTNVHTTLNPSGEIRGQNDWNYAVVDMAKAEIPATSTASAGTGTGSKSFAPALKPCLAVLFATAMFLMLLA